MNNLTPGRSLSRLYDCLLPTITFVKTHATKGIFFAVLIYLLSVKDINFQFSMGNNSSISYAQNVAYRSNEHNPPIAQPANLVKRKEKVQVAPVQVEAQEKVVSNPTSYEKVAKAKEVTKDSEFSISNLFSIAGFFDRDEQTKITAIKKQYTGKKPRFRNLSFILNPDAAEKYSVEEEEVNDKLTVCNNYVDRFASVAQSEMTKYGIPASIKLAQALLESDAGDSKLSLKHKNHFGIKCFSKQCKKGHCANFTDDTHKDFFRNFETSWESFRAHSLVLMKSRYQPLFDLNIRDYRSWAKGLSKAGYATDPNYAKKLIMIIEALELYEYDL